jgi:hypothetical protein
MWPKEVVIDWFMGKIGVLSIFIPLITFSLSVMLPCILSKDVV